MWNSRYEYCLRDENGRWINTEYPPDDIDKYLHNSGYRTPNREYLFYQFAVQYYDVRVIYKGARYILYADDDSGCAVLDEDWDEQSPYYDTANDLIREFRFKDGLSFFEIIDSEDFEIDIL